MGKAKKVEGLKGNPKSSRIMHYSKTYHTFKVLYESGTRGTERLLGKMPPEKKRVLDPDGKVRVRGGKAGKSHRPLW